MAEVILEVWQAQNMPDTPITIYPDGCCDVIWYQLRGQAPQWRVTPLDLAARQVSGVAGACMQGFRLRPGAVLSPDLMRGVLRRDTPQDAGAAIADMAHVPGDLDEVLAACTKGAQNVAALARELGVSARTVQRLTLRLTGQGPLYWLRLARLRQGFSAAGAGEPLAQAAAGAGFADQAHFTREAGAFYGESPARLLGKPRAMAAILAPGFGAVAGGV